MSEPAIYWGGMILSSMDSAYRYEEALAKFMRQRIVMFEDKKSFWGRNRIDLYEMERIAGFPEDAYYYVPEDPLITFPDYDRIHLLKRRYLNRLRQRLMKWQRQGGVYLRKRQWQKANAQAEQDAFVQNWIEYHKGRSHS